MRLRTSWQMAIVVVLVVLTGSCGTDSAQPEPGIDVVATTTILGDVVEAIVGTDATVETLLPIGADPHDYRASSQQVARLNQADLVVSNGLDLEEGLEDVLENAASDGANILDVGEHVDPIPFGDHNDDGGEHAHGSEDPHFWMDPLRVAEAARVIANELAKIDDSVDWVSRAEAYATDLEALDAEIITTLDVIDPDRRKLVTNHESLGYFAERYDFEVIGVVIPGGSTLGEPSSEELAALVRTIEAEGVPAIFVETTESTALAEAVADEVGEEIEVVELFTGSLGEDGSGAETLIGMLRTNAQRVAAALQH